MKNDTLFYASFLAAQIATGNAFITIMPTEHTIPQHFMFESHVFSSVTTSDNTDRPLVLDTVGNGFVATPTTILKQPQHSSSFESRIFSSVMTRDNNSDMELLEAVLRVEEAAPRRMATRTRASTQTKEGIFSPAVYAAKMLLGDNRLNEVRVKAISLHSGVIGSFVQTADTDLGSK
jgi:hypothetical protein